MTYPETLDYLYTRLPMFSRIGAAAYKADLTNTIRLCSAIGDPHEHFKTIHIAGTNGKGSVSHMLAAIFQTAGYKTGLYTSPHLHDFRERIKINGEMVATDHVIDFTHRIRPLIDEIEPSFFEITVAMAFDYFAREKVDIAIIETGLGGRLDSTNIITPELSVITNIGWDHMNILGDTLSAIAMEKAGIIKDKVPVIVGELIPESQPVFEATALSKSAPLTIATRARQVVSWQWEKNELVVEVAEPPSTDHKLYRLDLPGLYQTRNILTVLACCGELKKRGWEIDENHIQKGLQQTRKLTGLHGRWETIRTSPRVVLDVAHNPDGMRYLVQQAEVQSAHQLHIVLGMVKDKEAGIMLSLLPRQATYYFTRAQIPRALPEAELATLAAGLGLKGKTYPDVNSALQAALQHAHPDDLVIVCGSVFLVGEVNRSKIPVSPAHT